MELAERTVVITGGASGIGRALARRFAQEGPKLLVVADLNLQAAQDVAREVGGEALRVDVGREEEILALIDRARELGGPVDLFCSNAGVPGPPGGPEAPNEEWDRAWRVNVMAHVWAARALIPEMVQRGDGYLMSTASAAGLLTQVGAQVYSVTKHAAVAVAEWLAITYGDAGIKVSCLCPLGVRTPMLDGAMEDTVGAAALLQDDLLEPEDVAESVLRAIREERFLILPHSHVAEYMARRGADDDRWIAGMRRLVRRARESGMTG
jgi:NAD(P)-dependent dehydrogenase (short-subunit alcohol dehydrogenase family)